MMILVMIIFSSQSLRNKERCLGIAPVMNTETQTMTITQTKSQFLTEALIEVLNNTWKVNYIESGHPSYPQLEIDGGRKYIKVWQFDNYGDRKGNRSIYMFIDKETGAVYKPASTKAPATGIRFYLDQLVERPETCDQYGSFLYRR
jgi:hypothetical protein